MRRPTTRAEWREAVDLAELCFLIDSARQYGLIEGGPKIDAERCAWILRQGRGMGIHPRDHKALIDELLPALLAAHVEAPEPPEVEP